MLEIKQWQQLSASAKQQCLTRPEVTASKCDAVATIIEQVQKQGDAALLEFTKEWDGATLESLQVPQQEIQDASIGQEALDAIKQAFQSISTYHQSLLPEPYTINTATGISIRTEYRPIRRVGLYVPGGNKAPLVSSVLMQAIPAGIAGCPVKILCTPPNAQGLVNPHLLVAARLCGIENIYAVGGAQAIAAMAYGTQTVPKVDKIFGPGNSFVTKAKTIVACDVKGAAIDIPAGPSEVMVVADDDANPAFVAADLLAQAEHGVDSQVFLLCKTIDFAKQVNEQINQQLATLNRQEIIKQSLAYSCTLLCTTQDEQLDIINTYAPEHLILNCKDAANWVGRIYNAGTIFVGPWSAETMGDYVSGSNHVLPTNGYAKSYSGLSTLDFLTRFSVQTIQPSGLKQLGPAAMTIAALEGLGAHANAIGQRLKVLEG